VAEFHEPSPRDRTFNRVFGLLVGLGLGLGHTYLVETTGHTAGRVQVRR
jgi:hypothetical protein